MTEIGFAVTYIGPIAPRGVTRRSARRALKASWFDIGKLWAGKFRPKHFTEKGAREYKYTTRQGQRGTPGTASFRRSYTGRKYRTYGHRDPLVWTGQSRSMSRVARISATSNRVRISMSTPRLNYRHRSGRINMADELRRVSPREMREIVKTLERLIPEHLAKIDDSHTRNLGA